VIVGLFYLHNRPLFLFAGVGIGGHDDTRVRGLALLRAERRVWLVAGARVSKPGILLLIRDVSSP